MSFPVNPFEDAPAARFRTDNKKEVSEESVAENFKLFGWHVSLPMEDRGIDLIIRKYVCPNGHTELNGKPLHTCDQCNKPLILITRFIQVKTRFADEDTAFGYTLKTKDFPTDPRHVFLLYADQSSQFLIFPMYEYLYARHQLVENNQRSRPYSPMGAASMRQDNYKKNEFRLTAGVWSYTSNSIAARRQGLDITPNHVDLLGLESISTPQIEHNLAFLTEQIMEMKLLLFYHYNYAKFGQNTELRHQDDVAALRAITLQGNQNNLANIRNQRIQNRIDFVARNRNNIELLDTVSGTWNKYPQLRQDFQQRRP